MWNLLKPFIYLCLVYILCNDLSAHVNIERNLVNSVEVCFSLFFFRLKYIENNKNTNMFTLKHLK